MLWKKVCLWQNMSWTFLNFFSHSYFSLALFSTTSISYQTWFSIFVCVFCSFLFNYFHLFIIPLTYFICVVCVFFLFLSQQVFQALIEWYSSIKAILNIFIIFKLKVDGPSHPKNAIYVLSFIYTYLVHNWEKTRKDSLRWLRISLLEGEDGEENTLLTFSSENHFAARIE